MWPIGRPYMQGATEGTDMAWRLHWCGNLPLSRLKSALLGINRVSHSQHHVIKCAYPVTNVRTVCAPSDTCSARRRAPRCPAHPPGGHPEPHEPLIWRDADGPRCFCAPFPGLNPEVNEPHTDNFAVTSLSCSFAIATSHFPLHFCLILFFFCSTLLCNCSSLKAR